MNTSVFRELAAALKSGSAYGGMILSFVKCDWLAGSDKRIMNNAELIAVVDRLMIGWEKWEQQKPVDYHVGFVDQQYKPPKRAELGDTDSRYWENPSRDPWQRVCVLPLVNDQNDLLIYSTSSEGGKNCLGSLSEAYADHCEGNPHPLLPQIALASDSYNHPKFGKVHVPLLDIIGWVEAPNNDRLKRLKPPASSTPLLAPGAAQESLPPPRAGLVPDDDSDIPF
jgi:hypothetical protein